MHVVFQTDVSAADSTALVVTDVQVGNLGWPEVTIKGRKLRLIVAQKLKATFPRKAVITCTWTVLSRFILSNMV